MEPEVVPPPEILELPVEVMERVFGNLDGYSVHNVLLTCRLWRNVADTVAVWSQISDSFWYNLDGSQVTVSRFRPPTTSHSMGSLTGSLSDSGSSSSEPVTPSSVGPLSRSHGRRKHIKDGSEVLHQAIYHHTFHLQPVVGSAKHTPAGASSDLEAIPEDPIQNAEIEPSETGAPRNAVVSSFGSSNTDATRSTNTPSVDTSRSSSGTVPASASSPSLGSSSSSSSDISQLRDSIASLAIGRTRNAFPASASLATVPRSPPVPQAQSWHGARPPEPPESSLSRKDSPLRHTVSSPLTMNATTSSGEYPPFRELDASDAPEEDVLRRWLPSEEEITYILKEAHHVTVKDFKEYYRLISTCLIVDPSLNKPPHPEAPANADPMTIVTQMSKVEETLEQRLLRVNQELWTFGSPHHPLRRRRVFASLSAAVRHARDGDSIYLHKGIYTDSLTITKPIKLCGQMRIQDSIYLQAQIQQTIHWRAPPRATGRSHSPLSRVDSILSDARILPPSPGVARAHEDIQDENGSPRNFSRVAPAAMAQIDEPTMRGSLSCIDFSGENLNGEPSVIVHPNAVLDVHHSLFRNRRGTGIRVSPQASVQLLRTHFVGNVYPIDVSPHCTSFGLYKNIYKDVLSPDLLTLSADLAHRHADFLLAIPASSSALDPAISPSGTTHEEDSVPQDTPARNAHFDQIRQTPAPRLGGTAFSPPFALRAPTQPAPLETRQEYEPSVVDSSARFNTPLTAPSPPPFAALGGAVPGTVRSPPLASSIGLEAQYFYESVLSFVELLHIREFRERALTLLVPELLHKILTILGGPLARAFLPLAQNLVAAIHVFAKLEPARACITSLEGLKILFAILDRYQDDLFTQIEGLSSMWHLATQDALRPQVEALPIENLIFKALDTFEGSATLVSVALGALWNFSWLSDKISARIAPRLDMLFALQRRHLTNEQIQCNMCGLLWNLSTQPSMFTHLGKHKAAKAIAAALECHSSSVKLFRPTCALLTFLFNWPDQRREFVEAGGIATLVNAMAIFCSTAPDLFVTLDGVLASLWEGFPCDNEFDQASGLYVALKAFASYSEAQRLQSMVSSTPNLTSAASTYVVMPGRGAHPNVLHAPGAAHSLQQHVHHHHQHTHFGRSASPHAKLRPLSDLRLFSCCAQTKPSMFKLLSILFEALNIKPKQLQLLGPFQVNRESAAFEDCLTTLKNMDLPIKFLFVANILKMVLAKDPSRLFAVRGGVCDSLKQLTSSLVSWASTIKSSAGVAELRTNDAESVVSIRKNRLKTARRSSVGSDGTGRPSAAELLFGETSRMVFDCYATLCGMFDLDSRAGRLNVSSYTTFYEEFQLFHRSLLSLPLTPPHLLAWILDRIGMLQAPEQLLGLQTLQPQLPPPDAMSSAVRRFSALKLSSSWQVDSPAIPILREPLIPVYLDPKFKTRGILTHSDGVTVWNPHGSLESIRSNHFVTSGYGYFEIELVRVDGPSASQNEWHSASSFFMAGWCTARSIFFSAKMGVYNSPHSFAADPFARAKHVPTLHSPVPIRAQSPCPKMTAAAPPTPSHFPLSPAITPPPSPVSMSPSSPMELHHWKAGDRLQCCIDLDRKEICYGFNGSCFGAIFSNLDPSFDAQLDIGYAPAISLHQGCEVKFHFGDSCIYSQQTPRESR